MPAAPTFRQSRRPYNPTSATWSRLVEAQAWHLEHVFTYAQDGSLTRSGGPWGGVSRFVNCEIPDEDQPHLIEGLHQVTIRLGGLPQRWRFDRMATVCHPGSGRITASFGPVAMYYRKEEDCARELVAGEAVTPLGSRARADAGHRRPSADEDVGPTQRESR